MPARTAVPGAIPQGRPADGDADIVLPDESPASPSDRDTSPPEANQVGELKRRLDTQAKELKALQDKEKNRSESDTVLSKIKEAVTGKQPAATPDAGPMPDQYEEPEKYRQWLEAENRRVTREELGRYDRTRKTQDTQTQRDDLNDRTTETFVSSRPWLQNEDKTVNEEAFTDFQKYIDETGIEGRGPAGSLTVKQLEAAERSYRFEEILSEEGSRIQGKTVDDLRTGYRTITPRGRTSDPSDLESMAKENPGHAVDMLRELPAGEINARFDGLSREAKRRILPYLPGAAE